MKVTAEVKKIFKGSKIKAAATVTIEDIFVIRNVRLVEGVYGLFISMPSYKNLHGEYKSVCFPVTNEFRVQMLNALTNAYEIAITEHAADDGGQMA